MCAVLSLLPLMWPFVLPLIGLTTIVVALLLALRLCHTVVLAAHCVYLAKVYIYLATCH
jgi:hypothetical protein